MIDESVYYHISTTIDNDYVYFFSPYTGCLFCSSRRTGETKPVICVRMERDFEYRAVFNFNDKLYLLPYNTNVMKVIDKDETRCSDVVISTDGENSGITGCIIRDELLFLYGKSNYIVTYNVVTGETSFLNIDEKELKIQHEMKNCFWIDSYLLNGKVYIPTVYNELIVIDLDNKFEYIKLEDNSSDILQNNICVTPNGIHSIFFDKDMKSWKGLYDFDGGIKEKEQIHIKKSGELPFYTATFSNNMWIVFPAEANTIYVVGESIEKELLKRKCSIFSSKMADDYIFAIDYELGELIVFDRKTKGINEIEMWMDSAAENEVNSAINRIILTRNMCINESKVYTLNRFIKGLKV